MNNIQFIHFRKTEENRICTRNNVFLLKKLLAWNLLVIYFTKEVKKVARIPRCKAKFRMQADDFHVCNFEKNKQ